MKILSQTDNSVDLRLSRSELELICNTLEEFYSIASIEKYEQNIGVQSGQLKHLLDELNIISCNPS